MAARPPASMSLPAAKDLRARADRATVRAALAGTPRERFLRAQRKRLVERLLPAFAMIAVATGATALGATFDGDSRSASLALGGTAIMLAILALATTLAKRRLVALTVLSLVGAAVLVCGWAIAISVTGGKTSPYALAVPMGLTIVLLSVPLPPRSVPVIAIGAAAIFALAAPGVQPSVYVVFALLGGAGWSIARARRKRALISFRRMERLAASVSRMRRVQDQLVVVEKLEALRVLVGGMAHELNNALAVSLASTEQIASVAERDGAAATKAAKRAQGGLLRIRATIERLRRFALAEEGVLEPADVCAMLDFALDSAIGRARSGIIVERSYASDLAPIDTHVAGLAEALYQVAKNAVESMPKGGTVRASARREGSRVVLAVADEGSGIPPQRLAKVFDPFYAREATDTTFGSSKRVLPPLPGRSGLGLSTVYGIVTAIGGNVDIRSELGKGTEVAITLPIRPLSPE